MKLKPLTSIILLLTFTVAPCLQADAFVWKISNGENVLYLGGTTHVLAKSDFPLPAEFEKAYAASDKIIFETDIEAAKTPEFKAKLISTMTYKDGRTLKTVLSEENYEKLKIQLLKQWIPIELMNSFKASMVALIISVNELQKLDISMEGVDAYFAKKAATDKKPTGQLESIEQQIELIDVLGNGHENELMESTWKDLDELPKIMENLRKEWRTGDISSIEKKEAEMKADFPAIHEAMLSKRNQNWFPQIEAFFTSADTEFVLVGCLHLVGSDGILTQLKKAGYHIEQL